MTLHVHAPCENFCLLLELVDNRCKCRSAADNICDNLIRSRCRFVIQRPTNQVLVRLETLVILAEASHMALRNALRQLKLGQQLAKVRQFDPVKGNMLTSDLC